MVIDVGEFSSCGAFVISETPQYSKGIDTNRDLPYHALGGIFPSFPWGLPRFWGSGHVGGSVPRSVARCTQIVVR